MLLENDGEISALVLHQHCWQPGVFFFNNDKQLVILVLSTDFEKSFIGLAQGSEGFSLLLKKLGHKITKISFTSRFH
jgi:hypothetical protein